MALQPYGQDPPKRRGVMAYNVNPQSVNRVGYLFNQVFTGLTRIHGAPTTNVSNKSANKTKAITNRTPQSTKVFTGAMKLPVWLAENELG